MPDRPCDAVPVRVAGRLRSVDLTADGNVAFERGNVVLATTRRTITLPFESLAGFRVSGRSLELVVDTGDVVRLTPVGAVDDLKRCLVRDVCVLPELTLSLRGLGSRRAHPDAAHNRFFAPLIAARRRAEDASELEEVVAALEATALREALSQQLLEFAAERFADSPADRRALEAELMDCAEGLFARLAALQQVQEALATGEDASRFARWRAWVDGVRRVFESADACWFAVQPVLASPIPLARPPRWRRWLHRGGLLTALLAPRRPGGSA
jgi:hypothetical protein